MSESPALAPLPDRRIFLKIKLKSLAAEGREIRTAESKLGIRARAALRSELHEHRVNVVRRAARNTLLAYGFLRGRAREQIEPRQKTLPNWSEVVRMVGQYGVRPTEDMTTREYAALVQDQSRRLREWIDAGRNRDEAEHLVDRGEGAIGGTPSVPAASAAGAGGVMAP